MKVCILAAVSAVFLVISACSSDAAKRTVYDSLQNKAQIDCRENPGSACPDQKSYDEYQRSLNERDTRAK